MEEVEILSEGLSRLGIAFDENHLTRLGLFLDEIEFWNSDSRRGKKGLSLVRADRATLITKHILDSLAGLPVIQRFPHATIADIGSGAGFPGIPFAIFLPGSRVTLVERSGRKAAFLRNAAARLGLANVEVMDNSVEQLSDTFDVVMFRALKRIETVVNHLLSITAPEGVIAAYKGKRSEVSAELGALSAYETEVWPLEVPFLKEERNLVLLRISSVS